MSMLCNTQTRSGCFTLRMWSMLRKNSISHSIWFHVACDYRPERYNLEYGTSYKERVRTFCTGPDRKQFRPRRPSGLETAAAT